MGQVVGDCVIEADVVKTSVDGVAYGLIQNRDGAQASSTEVDELSGLCAIVENAIRENSDANIPAVVYPSIAWSATEYQTARLALVNAKSNLKTAVTTFLDTEYTDGNFCRWTRQVLTIINGNANVPIHDFWLILLAGGLLYWCGIPSVLFSSFNSDSFCL